MNSGERSLGESLAIVLVVVVFSLTVTTPTRSVSTALDDQEVI